MDWITFGIIAAVILILVFWVIGMYNKLVLSLIHI